MANISVKDASNASVTLKTTDNSGVHTPSQNVDAVVPGTGATNLGKAIDSAVGGTDTGVAALVKRRDTPATITPADGDYTMLHVDSQGRLQIAPVVNPAPTTSGGCSSFPVISAATTNAQNIKSTPGQVYGISVSNQNGSARYLKIYDKATTPVPASDAASVVRTIAIPGNSVREVQIPLGMAFTNGIGIAITAGVATNDATAIGANEVVLNVDYK